MGCSSSKSAYSDIEWDGFSKPDCILSILEGCLGGDVDVVGYTEGHRVITPLDEHSAKLYNSSLLYGEILTEGVTKLLGRDRLNATDARILYDLGCGTGKLALQAFIEHPNLIRVVGVELSPSRFRLAETAARRLCSLCPCLEIRQYIPGKILQLSTRQLHPTLRCRRIFELRCGNLFTDITVTDADVLVLHTELTPTALRLIPTLLESLKNGCRIVTYHELQPSEFIAQLSCNLSPDDTFKTSWSPVRGHHLYCWKKILPPPKGLGQSLHQVRDTKESFKHHC